MADGYDNDRPHFLSDEKVNQVVNTSGNSLFSIQVTMRALVESDPNTIEDVNNAYQGLLVCRVKTHFDVGKSAH
jgi:hypothetical protein